MYKLKLLQHIFLLSWVLLLTIGCDSNGVDGDNEDENITLIGQWEGEVTQSGLGYPDITYTTIMDIQSLEEGEDAGTISYPQLGCSGKLEYDNRESDMYTFFEDLSENPGNCVVRGRIDVELTSTGELSWIWYEIDGDGPFATATLSRR